MCARIFRIVSLANVPWISLNLSTQMGSFTPSSLTNIDMRPDVLLPRPPITVLMTVVSFVMARQQSFEVTLQPVLPVCRKSPIRLMMQSVRTARYTGGLPIVTFSLAVCTHSTEETSTAAQSVADSGKRICHPNHKLATLVSGSCTPIDCQLHAYMP